jgi:hypothetical protein
MQQVHHLRLKHWAMLVLLLIADSGFSQGKLDSIKVNVTQEQPLLDVLKAIEQQKALQFFYIEKWLAPIRVPIEFHGQSLSSVFKKSFEGTPISFVLINETQVIFLKDETFERARQQAINDARQRQKTVKKIVIGNPQRPAPGRSYRVEGTFINENDLPVNGVSLLIDQTGNGTLTDQSGKFGISLTPGEHFITISHVNYQPVVIDLEMYGNGTMNLTLADNPVFLDDVVVTGQAIADRPVGQTILKVAELKRAPTFLGEVDIVKQVQQEAGVTTVGEITTGFNVRGGSVDQNLVLLDGVPVYNTAHALGFFSAFHSDAIGSLSFYKAGIPATYGGRTSSVLNVIGKTGNKQQWRYKAGIGMISSYALAEGPIRKDTSSLLFSFRTTYSNWMLRAIQSNYVDLQNSSAKFFDGNFKYTSRIRKNSNVTVSGYISQDAFRLVNDTTFQWRNIAVSARYDTQLPDNWFANITAGVGHYQFGLKDDEPNQAFEMNYSLLNPIMKVDFAHEGNHKINVGLQGNFYQFKPGYLEPGQSSELKSITIPDENAWELGLYLSDEFTIKERLTVEAGLRYVLYLRTGPGVTREYEAGKPRLNQHVIDSTTYLAGELMNNYHGPEPRLGVRYSLSKRSTIKLGFHRLYQFMHLVTNTAAPTPVDIWQLSNTYFKPQVAHQVSLGYFWGDRETKYDFSIDGFAKQIDNTLDYKDGASLILNQRLETALLTGVTKSYGIEFSVTKKTGRWVGSGNYTYSRSLRQVKTLFESEQVNEGDWYPSNYDQPHVLNVTWRYNISRRYFFSGNFVYHTGRPISMPSAFYTVNGVPISDFSERNGFRLKDYHRMDLAFIAEGNHKRKKIWDGTWTLSFYNVYARKNPYSIFFQQDANGRLKPYQLSLIGAVIPSLSYSIKI